MLSKLLVVVFGFLVLLSTTAQLARAATPAQKCQSTKLKAAGAGISSKMGCFSKAKAKAVPVDPGCLTKSEVKFSGAFLKAGAACPGAANVVQAAVNDCVNELVADVPGDGKCPSIGAKTEGSGASNSLSCAAREVFKPGSFAACSAKNDGKVSGTLAKAGACVSGDALADIHQCEAAVSVLIEPGVSTTSTTVTTSTSTSTTSTSFPPCTVAGAQCGLCGKGICQPHCPDGVLACVDSSQLSLSPSCNDDATCATAHPSQPNCAGVDSVAGCGAADSSFCYALCP